MLYCVPFSWVTLTFKLYQKNNLWHYLHQYCIKHPDDYWRHFKDHFLYQCQLAVTQTKQSRETLAIIAPICNIWIFPHWAWQSHYLSQLMCRELPAQPRHSWPTAAAQTDQFLQQSNDASQVYMISPWYPFGFRICPFSWLPALWERHRSWVWDGPGRELPLCVRMCMFICVCVYVCVWAVQWSICKLCQLTCSEWASTAEHLQQLHRKELWNCFHKKLFAALHITLFWSAIKMSQPRYCFYCITIFEPVKWKKIFLGCSISFFRKKKENQKS